MMGLSLEVQKRWLECWTSLECRVQHWVLNLILRKLSYFGLLVMVASFVKGYFLRTSGGH
ncbi:hypothetical protein Hanom_Chr12g01171381 [Helianthus anomalus]